jgi:mRNA interferase MazF
MQTPRGTARPATGSTMKRGEIWFANPGPTQGSETAKRRPVLIVSNDANNRGASTVTILPITSNVTRIYPFEVALGKDAGGLTKASKAQAQQVRTISRERILGKRIGALRLDDLAKVDAALQLHLSL